MLKNYKRIFSIILFLSVSVTTLLTINYVRSPPQEFYKCEDTFIKKYENIDEKSNYELDLFKPETKYALLWTPYHGDVHWGLNRDTIDHHYFEKLECVETKCVITTNRTLIDIEKFDSIVFSGSELWDDIPAVRHQNQMYVFATLDPPTKMLRNLSYDANFFNMTMTYRLDSDIFFGGGRFQHVIKQYYLYPHKENKWIPFNNKFFNKKLVEMAKQKTKDVLYIDSGCWMQSQANKIIDSLSKLMDVDIVKPCNKKGCPISNDLATKFNTTYKFIAVFENSLCDDYLSEKVFIAMEHYVIPIVYSGVEYEHYLPHHSYIDANHFESVEKLADHLKMLSSNPNEYIKYFHWKTYYRALYSVDFCGLCVDMHKPNHHERISIYNDIEKWWLKGFCSKPKLQL
jgi:alpha-1,3-fucosyltransferase